MGRAIVSAIVLGAVIGCATQDTGHALTAAEARRWVEQQLPTALPDRGGWAADIVAAFTALQIAATRDNLCAALAVTEQESSFRADPAVPGLAAIARQEIDRRAERAGVPQIAVRAALGLTSPDGRSYGERIDAVRTERELSELFDDFIDMVPLGRTFFSNRNPVRTGGAMQVSIAFAEANAERYPYRVPDSIRREVFTRRGGLYFGIAHLLDYEAPYLQPLYRFADFNAGRYASRNAAFQNALALASGIRLVLDGDLLPPGLADPERPGSTEKAAFALAGKLEMSQADVRRDLQRGTEADFERTRLYQRVYALADQRRSSALPRAVLPRITLQSPKITRRLTTEWFARRVDERHQRCMARASDG